MDKDFLTVKDVAKELSITERTARALFKKGTIKGRKVAGKYITTKDLLKAYIEQKGEGTGAPEKTIRED
ncbi:MAG TPA: helix-turn-helix domain-containing protein [Candidatus Eremiobacteraeota bacterium]|nr:helix-turn-helix domain-containing protein [Candidatus Eremiobacteraeota bacterium]